MYDTLEVNGYSIIVDVNEFKPLANGTKYEAKVTKIYDQINKARIWITHENTSIYFGKTESETYKKAQNAAREWALRQR